MLRGSEAQKQEIKELSVVKLQLQLLLFGVAAVEYEKDGNLRWSCESS